MKKNATKDDVKDTEPKKPKKRVRKPKKKEPVKQEGDMDIQENLIIKLNHTEEKEDPIMAYENTDNQAQNCNNTISEMCWNCSHPFNNSIIGLPLKYDNDIFYIYGDFCSLECGARYAYEYFPDKFRDICQHISKRGHTLLSKSLQSIRNRDISQEDAEREIMSKLELLLSYGADPLVILDIQENNLNLKLLRN